MSSNHTPGPWTAEQNQGNPEALYFIRHTGGKSSLATVSCLSLKDKSSHHANAHLIGAAPDLYEALSRLTEYISRSDMESKLEELCIAAKVALVKATGI